MDWSNLSQTVRSLLRSAAKSSSVQQSGIEVLQGIGKHISENAHDPERLKRLGETLQRAAPAVLGAIVKGTPAENMVDQHTLQQANSAAAE